jgi:hypothetical protein
MKTVFSNSMCAHVWAQQTQHAGWTSGGNMRFEGGVAYSYAARVANIITTPSGARVALFTSDKWSVTTSAHVSEYRSAASHYTSFSVPDIFPSGDHAKNVAYFKRRYAEEVAKMLRAPADSWRIHADRAGETLREVRKELHAYEAAFNLPRSTLDVDADAAAITARRDRLLNDPKRAAKREAGRLARERAEARRADLARLEQRERVRQACERVMEWRAGADVRLHYGDVRCANGDPGYGASGGNVVRIYNGRVQTDAGAECPLAHARRAMKWWRQCVNVRAPYRAGEHHESFPLGHFTLSSIDAEGNARAGCHYFKRAELEHLEKLLAESIANSEVDTISSKTETIDTLPAQFGDTT